MAGKIIESYNDSAALAPAAFGAVGAAPTPVTNAAGMPTRSDGVSDGAIVAAWDGSAFSTAGYSSAYLEVTTYNTAITVKAGSAAANAVDVINTNGSASASTITATGLYLIPYLAGNLTLAGLGAGVVNLILKR